MFDETSETSENWPTGDMVALQISSTGEIERIDVSIPNYEQGHALVRVAYVGLCGTDVEFIHRNSAFVREGLTRYPVRFGHEWSGTVVAVSSAEGPNIGDEVVGHPFRTCGSCRACQSGRPNVCVNHDEIGVRGSSPGAASSYIRVPNRSVTVLPPAVSMLAGALVEPSVTAVQAAVRCRLRWDDRVAVIGTGTLGLQAIRVALGAGATVDAIGIDKISLGFAREIGVCGVYEPSTAQSGHYDVVIEASGASSAVAASLDLLRPGGRVALIGMAGEHAKFHTGLAVIKDAEIHAILHGIHNYPSTVDLLANGKLLGEELVDSVFHINEVNAAFDRLASKGRKKPKVLITFDSGRVLRAK